MKKLSIILIDWSVRESFHALDCLSLNKQTAPRSDYEIIWVEWYSDRPRVLQEHYLNNRFDKWIVMGQTGMYFKHRMINEGITAAEGKIIVIPDSDAMFQPTFVQSILDTFEAHKDERMFLYMDEIRSANRSFYPIDKTGATWDEIMAAPGLENWRVDLRKPIGLVSDHDKIHWANYGSCFCARRDDIIEFGGLDEHKSYHCFLCGFYELGWRMVNGGFIEHWHPSEFLLHAWHPWVKSGETMGPNDGLGVNMTALEIPKTGRLYPFVENEKIRLIRTEGGPNERADRAWEPVADPVPLQRHTLTFGQTLRSLFRPVKVNRVLLVMEYARGRIAWPVNPAEFAGLVGRVEVFPYAMHYHLYGKQEMERRLILKCKQFKPQLIIFVEMAHNRFKYEVEPSQRILGVYPMLWTRAGSWGWTVLLAEAGFPRNRLPRIFYLIPQFLSWAAKRLPGRIVAMVLPDKVKYRITVLAERLGITISG